MWRGEKLNEPEEALKTGEKRLRSGTKQKKKVYRLPSYRNKQIHQGPSTTFYK